MKKILCILFCLLPVLGGKAQTLYRDQVRIEKESITRNEDNNVLSIDMDIVMQENLKLSSNHVATLTPFLESNGRTKILPSIVVYGRKREVVNQVLGNVLVPVGCVGGGAKIYKKYADKIESIIPQIKSPKQSAQIFNKVLKSIPNGVCTLGLLGLGLYLGNKVSNFLNEHIYHKKVDRNMKFTDCAPHVDDVCMAVSMMNEESPFAAKLERVIPLALLVPGYETGTAREH